jgi:hypothetical protein
MAFTHFGTAHAAQTAYPGDRITGDHFATRAPIQAVNGAAASAQPLATMVGIDILKAGGNAVDAAIAMNAVIGLMEPVGNGIGGDIFVLIYDPETREVYGLNGAGRSPMGLDIETVRAGLTPEGTIPPVGALPVSVPCLFRCPEPSMAGLRCMSGLAACPWSRSLLRLSAMPRKAFPSARPSRTTGSAICGFCRSAMMQASLKSLTMPAPPI